MRDLILFISFLFLINCDSTNKKDVVSDYNSVNQDANTAKAIISVYKKKILLGKYNYKTDSSFVKIPKSLSNKTIYINEIVKDSFVSMVNAAKKDSIYLIAVSGTRNFLEQKRIWDRKWNKLNLNSDTEKALKILEYSSMPSTSRHHWGTDIDLINLNNSYFESGRGLNEYNWLCDNANKFGFFQVYTSKNNGRTGYNMEKWHWSFKPLSDRYLDLYLHHINYGDINGFQGYEVAPEIDVIDKYVNGIE